MYITKLWKQRWKIREKIAKNNHGIINYQEELEEQTTEWPKENVQKDKQRSTKHTYKTKYRVTRTPLKTGAPEG
jgi:hypothetical protein